MWIYLERHEKKKTGTSINLNDVYRDLCELAANWWNVYDKEDN